MADYSRGILSQDTIVTVTNTSRIQGGIEGDFLSIDTVINLSVPEPQEITLLLPNITGDPQRAYLRTLGEVENRQEFQSPFDQEQLDLLTDEMRKELLEEEEQLKAKFEILRNKAQEVRPANITIDAGSQEIKFFLQKEIKAIGTDEYEFSFVAPLCNFSVNQGPFQMSVMILLPKGATLLSTQAISPEGVPDPVLVFDQRTPDRNILQYHMQYDPIFTVRYRY
ncbi:hypothetical protein HMPREF3291_18420 [Bacillus sp. HMSC76G11]|nr:hypothetical protein HMPREF3291_18420 [Bacillus sp. HMSC76G11]